MIHPAYDESQSTDEHVMTTDSLVGTFDAIVRLHLTAPSTPLTRAGPESVLSG